MPRDGDASIPVGPEDVFLATFWTTADGPLFPFAGELAERLKAGS